MIDLMVVVFLVSAVAAEQGDDLARKNVEVDPCRIWARRTRREGRATREAAQPQPAAKGRLGRRC
jgi:hypothetical protein